MGGITISDMNKDRNKGNSQDKNDNIFIKLYENSKEKRKKRQRSEGEQKHRKIKPDRKPPSDTNNCYKMSSRPRGSALLINNETFLRSEFYPARPGSRVDMMNLQVLFGKLGFRVETR